MAKKFPRGLHIVFLIMPRPNPAPVRDARFDMSKWAESDKGKAAKRVRVGEKKEGRKGEGRRAVPVEEEEEEEKEEDDREDEEEDEEDGGEEDEDEDEDDEDKDEQGEDEQDEGQEVEDDDDSANANDDDANDRQRTLDEIESNTHQPVLTAESLESYAKKQQKRGIVYVSRIPPGMTPAKVRHIFSQFGEVGRIYLQPKDKEKEKKRKRGTTHFSEGWIEYLSKRVARTAAEMMNAQPIGSLAGSAHSSRKSQTGSRVANRWKDDVWTMKYLKGFRWPMLIEQMCTSPHLTQRMSVPPTPHGCVWSSRSLPTSSATIYARSNVRVSSARKRSAVCSVASPRSPRRTRSRSSSARQSTTMCATSVRGSAPPSRPTLRWTKCWIKFCSLPTAELLDHCINFILVVHVELD